MFDIFTYLIIYLSRYHGIMLHIIDNHINTFYSKCCTSLSIFLFTYLIVCLSRYHGIMLHSIDDHIKTCCPKCGTSFSVILDYLDHVEQSHKHSCDQEINPSFSLKIILCRRNRICVCLFSLVWFSFTLKLLIGLRSFNNYFGRGNNKVRV